MAVRDIVQAAAGAAGEENLYIEDVFSTWLYTGTGAAQTITNGIDLDGEGGLVWTKFRSGSFGTEAHAWIDTVRGGNYYLSSNSTIAQVSLADLITSFNSNGYTLGADATSGKVNYSAQNYASWTFRKAPKFFDVVTYTGTGSAQNISHNLGADVGCLIVKRTDTTENWTVWHRGIDGGSGAAFINLNLTSGYSNSATRWNNTAPTSTQFTVGTHTSVNASGSTYVAYLFAHDAGGFGDDSEQNVITCGSVVGAGASGTTVTLGYEPQWILIKNASASQDWWVVDNMRGLVATVSASSVLRPNLSDAETTGFSVQPTATGFTNFVMTSGQTYIYIAIRRGPMKTPESGTEVYNAGTVQNNTGRTISPELGYPVDWFWNKQTGVNNWIQMTRLTGAYVLNTASTAAEVNYSVNGFDNSKTFEADGIAALSSYGWMFRRAPGFFDVVCYTGTGSAGTVDHNLGVAPELIIVKSRSGTYLWNVYHSSIGTDGYLKLNASDAVVTGVGGIVFDDPVPSSTTFNIGFANQINISTGTYVAYLFATLAGVSKVGSYTGTGTTLAIDCGFSAGARFVMIKRTDSTGDWYVWDSARGIVSGDDPYLLLNSTAAEVTNTDYIDTSSAGFEISSTAPAAINASGGNFIFLAIS